uniref:C2H2-type domain-containing protein n=1 Tax=Timema monikensis TaxID=170555 RepID=A0A7R9HLW3_9NEOP|nr:unnamed protein product [Timema monikensis]
MLIRHYNTHIEPPGFNCTDCDSSFAIKVELLGYFPIAKEEVQFKCLECGISLSTKRFLPSHYSSHIKPDKGGCKCKRCSRRAKHLGTTHAYSYRPALCVSQPGLGPACGHITRVLWDLKMMTNITPSSESPTAFAWKESEKPFRKKPPSVDPTGILTSISQSSAGRSNMRMTPPTMWPLKQASLLFWRLLTNLRIMRALVNDCWTINHDKEPSGRLSVVSPDLAERVDKSIGENQRLALSKHLSDFHQITHRGQLFYMMLLSTSLGIVNGGGTSILATGGASRAMGRLCDPAETMT